jgi:RND family efflux transporter MFP subunit
MKMDKILYVVIINVMIFTISCKNENEQNADAVKLVKVTKVSEQQNAENLTFNGKVKENSLTMLSFRVGGPLVNVNVKEGDYVQEGDVIAKIDQRDYKIQLENAKAQFEQVSGEYERYKELYEKAKIPANTYEKLESGYKMAKAGYENALNQLNDTELKAPISGYIHQKLVENYATVGAGHPVVSIMEMSKLEIIIHVSENQVLDIENCQNYFVSVKNANVFDLPVKLLSVNEKTGKDGLYKVKFILQNKDDLHIYPGMTAEVKIECKKEKKSILISSDAVLEKNNSTYVWLYNPSEQSIKLREVVIASLKPEGELEVIKGLSDGDQIIASGVHALFEGQKVKPITKRSATNVGGLL